MQICPDESSWHGVGVEIELFGPGLWFRHKTVVLRNVNLVCAIVENCVVGMGALAPPLLRHKTMVLFRRRVGASLSPPAT